MKKMFWFLISIATLLSIIAGCSNAEENPPEIAPDSVVNNEQTTANENEQAAAEPTSPTKLGVSDLIDILNALDLTDASLTFHSKTEETYATNAAICVQSYIGTLKSLTWESYTPISEPNENTAIFYRLTTPDVTITAYQGLHETKRPVHLFTADGEGWFIPPYIEGKQTAWGLWDIFQPWHKDAKTASLYGGSGVALTVEEMEYFQEYTEGIRTEYNAETGGYYGYSTEISCFFHLPLQ